MNRLLPLLAVVFLSVYGRTCCPKKALIFGITGQDGIYLAEFLLEKGYEVHGIRRASTVRHAEYIDELSRKYEHFLLHEGDITDSGSVQAHIHHIAPDEVYNLAAQSQVKASFGSPEQTAVVNALGALKILEAIRSMLPVKQIKFYQASSSEMFGKVRETPQRESTPFYPRSPYGAAKLYAHSVTVNYREAYEIFACSGILFNHESPLRGEDFVTRKITIAAVRIKRGLQDALYLGNLSAQRDWGYAKDYVEAMWAALQQDRPDDYVIATGEAHSVREFAELAFKEVGINLSWCGSGVEEIGINAQTGAIVVRVDPQYFRPTEVDSVLGDPTKAFDTFGWKAKTPLSEVVKIMVQEDLKRIS